jgi:hypothetical protein
MAFGPRGRGRGRRWRRRSTLAVDFSGPSEEDLQVFGRWRSLFSLSRFCSTSADDDVDAFPTLAADSFLSSENEAGMKDFVVVASSTQFIHLSFALT